MFVPRVWMHVGNCSWCSVCMLSSSHGAFLVVVIYSLVTVGYLVRLYATLIPEHVNGKIGKIRMGNGDVL